MSKPRTFPVIISPSVVLSCRTYHGTRGVPLLFVHGYGDSRACFEPLIAALPEDLTKVAVSQRGHGDSSKPRTGYAIADFAGDLAVLLDRLEIERAVVVGHSMGSMVSLQLALDRPERVQALVLIGALATLNGNAAARGLWDDTVSTISDPIDPAFVRAFQESTLARPVSEAFLDGVVRESLKVPARVWQAALRAMLDQDLASRLPRIAAPALIVWGDQDGLCGHDGQLRLADRLPDARLSVRAGSGHAPHWEDPEGIAVEIAEFVTRAARAAA